MAAASDIRGTVSLDLRGCLGDFQRDLDAVLSDMFQLCAASREKRYAVDTVNRSGVLGVLLPEAAVLGETAPQRAARNAFIGAMSKFSGLLDRLIATQRVAKDGIPITRVLQGEAEILAYLKEAMDAAVADVARDPRLSVPKKLECFGGVDTVIREWALSYNALRNALEHHHDLPKHDLTVTMRRVIPIIGDQEITELPKFLPEGGTLGVKIISVEKTFPANQKVILEPQDGYDLIFTIRQVIGVAIFQWHVSSEKP